MICIIVDVRKVEQVTHKSAFYSVQEETDKSHDSDENTEGSEKIESSDGVDACEEDGNDKGAGVGHD